MCCPQPKLDATGQRWIAALQGPYNFKVHYKPGKLNQVADSLSRIDREGDLSTIMEVEVQAILDSGGAADVSIPFVGITQDGKSHNNEEFTSTRNSPMIE